MNELAVTISLPLDRFDLDIEFTTTAQVTGVFGPSGARMLGRFCHGDPALAEALIRHLQAEEARRKQE